MKVQRIEFANNNHIKISQNGLINPQYTLKFKQDEFQPSFKGYNDILEVASMNLFKNDAEVEKAFKDLIHEIISKRNIHKNPSFDVIFDEYNKKGLRGLLYGLWRTNPEETFSQFYKEKDYNCVHFITDKGQPLFELEHFGKFDYSKNNPNDVRLIFRNQSGSKSIEFGLNKKGELVTDQNYLSNNIITRYHLSTGERKVVVEQLYNGNIETTYYKKDGTKSFWQNLFRGGITIIPQ